MRGSIPADRPGMSAAGAVAEYAIIAPRLPSVEPSSSTMTRSGGRVWARNEAIAAPM